VFVERKRGCRRLDDPARQPTSQAPGDGESWHRQGGATLHRSRPARRGMLATGRRGCGTRHSGKSNGWQEWSTICPRTRQEGRAGDLLRQRLGGPRARTLSTMQGSPRTGAGVSETPSDRSRRWTGSGPAPRGSAPRPTTGSGAESVRGRRRWSPQGNVYRRFGARADSQAAGRTRQEGDEEPFSLSLETRNKGPARANPGGPSGLPRGRRDYGAKIGDAATYI